MRISRSFALLLGIVGTAAALIGLLAIVVYYVGQPADRNPDDVAIAPTTTETTLGDRPVITSPSTTAPPTAGTIPGTGSSTTTTYPPSVSAEGPSPTTVPQQSQATTTTTRPQTIVTTPPPSTTIPHVDIPAPPGSDTVNPPVVTVPVSPPNSTPDPTAPLPPVTIPETPPVYETIDVDACAALDLTEIGSILGGTPTTFSSHSGECEYDSAADAKVEYAPADSNLIAAYFEDATAQPVADLGDSAVVVVAPYVSDQLCVAAKSGLYGVTACVIGTGTPAELQEKAAAIVELALEWVTTEEPGRVEAAPTTTTTTTPNADIALEPGFSGVPVVPTTAPEVTAAGVDSDSGLPGGIPAPLALGGGLVLLAALGAGLKTGALAKLAAAISGLIR